MIQKNTPIFIIGYMGSDRECAGNRLSKELGRPLLSLDQEIEKRDGRTILRLCMTMGEHEYRNKEYELLKEFLEKEWDLAPVIICGDGVLLDDMNYSALLKLFHEHSESVVLVEDSLENLWACAKEDRAIPYAFMQASRGGVEDKARFDKFCDLYESRKLLYNQFKKKKEDLT